MGSYKFQTVLRQFDNKANVQIQILAVQNNTKALRITGQTAVIGMPTEIYNFNDELSC
jgi:hypothetical protein